MKQLLFFILFLIGISSCNKPDVTTPPIENPPISSKLIKAVVGSISDNTKNIDSFFYDTQKRIIRFQYAILGSAENVWNVYDFTYTANNLLPNSYNFTYIKSDVSGVYSYLTINELKFNAQNKVIEDSTISSNFPISSPMIYKYYKYSDKLVTTTTKYPNNSSYSLDSFFLDNDGNTIKKLSGTVDANNKFTLEGKIVYTFGNTISPYYNNTSGLAPSIIYGFPNFKHLQISGVSTNYSVNGSPTIYNSTYKNITDASGLVTKIISNIDVFSSVSEFTYY